MLFFTFVLWCSVLNYEQRLGLEKFVMSSFIINFSLVLLGCGDKIKLLSTNKYIWWLLHSFDHTAHFEMKLLEGKEEKENLFNDLFCPTSSPYKFEY